jgi:hypothetical protein
VLPRVYGSGLRLPTEVDSSAVMCPTILDLTSLVEVGSGAAICPMTPDLASRLKWDPALPHAL